MTVFVVTGWVPEGDALGKGVMVTVGSGLVGTGVTVAVGRGPAGMLGLGIGVAVSLGDWASTCATDTTTAMVAPNLKKRFTVIASGPPAMADVSFQPRMALCARLAAPVPVKAAAPGGAYADERRSLPPWRAPAQLR
ncbi:hypothetical protein BH20VER3_BH20VER3_20050 [soil metagenome]